jgi:asparagine synthase (glutamine-hydrolysing)
LKGRGLFDPKAVSKLVEDDYNGRIDAGYTIFSLMCLEWWIRIFLSADYAD